MGTSKLLEKLFQRGCLQLSPGRPFTYASGLKGPIYCDNRKLLSFPEDRNLVLQSFLELFKSLKLEDVCVAGMATAGIPHATLIADRLGLPLIYVRSKPKGHGKGNQVEGVLNTETPVVLVEDLVNQGKSLLEGVSGLRKAEGQIQKCLCIVDYGMPEAKKRIQSENLELHSLITFENIIDYGLKHNLLSQQDFQLLKDWQQDPVKWSERFNSEPLSDKG